VVKILPSLPSIAQPASSTPASTSAGDAARLVIAMNKTPEVLIPTRKYAARLL
jgi:hypothetical protein